MSLGGILYVVLGVVSFALVGFFAWMVARQRRKLPGSREGLARGAGRPEGHEPRA